MGKIISISRDRIRKIQFPYGFLLVQMSSATACINFPAKGKNQKTVYMYAGKKIVILENDIVISE